MTGGCAKDVETENDETQVSATNEVEDDKVEADETEREEEADPSEEVDLEAIYEEAEVNLLPDCGYALKRFSCYINQTDDYHLNYEEELYSTGHTMWETLDNNGTEVVITSIENLNFFETEERVEDGEVTVTATYSFDEDNFMRGCEMVDGNPITFEFVCED